MKNAYWALLTGLVLAPAVVRAAEMKAAPSGGDVVAVSLPVYEGPIATGKQAVEDEAAALGVKLDLRSAQWSPELQLGQLEDFVARRVQGIIVYPVPRGAKAEKVDLRPVLDAASAARIPVAVIGERVASRRPLVQVHADQHRAGLLAAQLLAERLHGQGGVLVLQGPAGAGFNAELEAGLVEGLASTAIRVLARTPAGFERGSGKGVMAGLLAKHPQFEAVVAVSDELILGAIDAMVEAGIDPATKVTVGWDGTAEARRYVQEGKLTATFDADGAAQGREAVRALVRYLRDGEAPPIRDVVVPPRLIVKGPQG